MQNAVPVINYYGLDLAKPNIADGVNPKFTTYQNLTFKNYNC